MLEVIFPTSHHRYAFLPLFGSRVDDFARWLAQCGYRPASIRVYSAKMHRSMSHMAEDGDVGGINSASTVAGVRTITILPSRVRCSLSSEIKVHPACWATAAYTASAPRKPCWAASARA